MDPTAFRIEFRRGLWTGLPFLLVVIPFAALFGALASGAGLSVLEVLGFSVIVVAGAAQFTALQLMTEQAPTLVVIVSALAVNLRMAMYSASLATHVGEASLATRVAVAYCNVDQSYASSVLEFERRPDMGLQAKLGYFFGIMAVIAPGWYVASVAGAIVGPAILPDHGTEVFLPLTFLAMIAPGLRTSAHRWAAVAATIAGVVLSFMPLSLGLIPAALIGMVVGAEIERRQGAAP